MLSRDEDRLRPFRSRFAVPAGSTYLDTASVGLSPLSHLAAAADFITQRGNPAVVTSWDEGEASAREGIAALVGAAAADVTFAGSTSEALNLFAQAVPWQRDDEVVMLDDDFPSVLHAWQTATTSGGRIVRLARDPERSRTDQLVEALGRRTRVVAVSHVHSATGEMVDLGRLGRACREVDAVLVCDGIQALGAVPVDLSMVDVYACGSYKWLLSGFGCGFLVVGARAADGLVPGIRGHRNPPPSAELQYTHVNRLGWALVTDSLRMLSDTGWTLIHQQIAALAQYAVRSLDVAGFEARTHGAGIVTVTVDDTDRVVEALRARGICAASRGGRVRISPHAYNTFEDLDIFVAGLVATAPTSTGSQL